MSSIMKLKSRPPPPQSVVASVDLLLEILVRLPLRPLIRFKSVSKHWNSLISDPEFHSALVRKSKKTATGIIFQNRVSNLFILHSTIQCASIQKSTNNNNNIISSLDHLTSLFAGGVAALNSCNGLLLGGGPDYDPKSYSYYVCNPTTKKHSTLPKLVGNNEKVEGMCLAFDPSHSPHYNVVCVRRLGSEFTPFEFQCEFGFEVFSSETGCWRKSGNPFLASCVDFKRGVHWNGAIHCIGYYYNGKSLYFDPTDLNETSHPKVMPTPLPARNKRLSSFRLPGECEYFGESGSHLHFIDYYDVWGNNDMVCSVHEMRMDYSEWFVKYKICFSPLVCTTPRQWFVPNFCVWALVRGEKDEDSFLVLKMKRSLVRYNFVCRTLETISELEARRFKEHYLLFPVQHIESLCEV